jgi:hypothetical protein
VTTPAVDHNAVSGKVYQGIMMLVKRTSRKAAHLSHIIQKRDSSPHLHMMQQGSSCDKSTCVRSNSERHDKTRGTLPVNEEVLVDALAVLHMHACKQ